MQEKLKLNDGSVINGGSAILSDGTLFLYMPGLTMKQAFDLLIDPVKTMRIEYTEVNGEKITYNGYTRLKSLTDEGSEISAVLKREEN